LAQLATLTTLLACTAAQAEPPTGFPYTASGNFVNANGQSRPITLTWVDIPNWTFPGEYYPSVPLAQAILPNTTWGYASNNTYYGNMRYGNPPYYLTGNDGTIIELTKFDYGIGTQIKPTIICIATGFTYGILIWLTLSLLEWLIHNIKDHFLNPLLKEF